MLAEAVDGGLAVAVCQRLHVVEALGGGVAIAVCAFESAGGGGSCRLLAEAVEAVGGGLAVGAVCQNLQVEAAAAGCWQRL